MRTTLLILLGILFLSGEREGAARSQAADPSVEADVLTEDYIDTQVAAAGGTGNEWTFIGSATSGSGNGGTYDMDSYDYNELLLEICQWSLPLNAGEQYFTAIAADTLLYAYHADGITCYSAIYYSSDVAGSQNYSGFSFFNPAGNCYWTANPATNIFTMVWYAQECGWAIWDR